MDPLRAALDKARLGQAAPPRGGFAEAPSGFDLQRDLWRILPALHLRPSVMERHRIVTLQGGAASTAYDLLRTRLLHRLREHGWRRIAIVSARSAAGKTTTTANLALCLARQTELRSLVLDLDLRRPNLARVLGQSVAHGMADVLEGRIGFAEHGRRYGGNLIFGLTGDPAPHSAELLQSRRAAEVLDGLDEMFQPDLCLYDMPPMMAADDTLGFLGNVDCALLVAEAERTSIAQIDLAERQLAELTNVLGIVLNRCRFPDDVYGYEDGYY